MWPITEPQYTPARFIPFVQAESQLLDMKMNRIYHGLSMPAKIEISCAKRSFRPTKITKGDKDKLHLDERGIVDLITVPMMSFGLDGWISNLRSIEPTTSVSIAQGDEVLDRFYSKFNIKNLEICRSHMAQETINRVARDWDYSFRYDERQIPCELTCFTKSDIQGFFKNPNNLGKASIKIRTLHKELVEFYERDNEEAQIIIHEFLSIMRQASRSDLHQATFKLAHDSGHAPCHSFEYFASLLLDKAFDARISEINPYLDVDAVRRSESLLVSALLRLSRAGLVSRCISTAEELIRALDGAQLRSEAEHAAAFNGISLKAAALAELLSTRRGYADVVRRDTMLVEYDPRFLLFEFSANIILRDAQIRLVRTFVDAAEKGDSLCHQLIMGAGKTTVIAPLLALILGSPKRLVVQVLLL